MGPVSLWASSAIWGKTPVPPGNGSGLNPLKLCPPPSSNTDQPKGSLSLPPCLFLMPLHHQVSSPEPGLGLSRTWYRTAHGIPCVPPRFAIPPSPCNTFQGHYNCVALEREEKKSQREHMCRAGGNGCCKVSSAFKEVFVWSLFSYPLGNFTAEEAGPFRQRPKQYPHCLNSSRGSARLGGAGGAEGDGEEKFLLPAVASKHHGGRPVIKTSLRMIKSLGCQVE